MKFNIINSSGEKTAIEITNVRKEFVDAARLDAEYLGMELKGTLLSYGAGHTKPFLRFMNSERKFVDAVLTDEIMEYIWNEIGSPKDGLLYSYTNNYKSNWCD